MVNKRLQISLILLSSFLILIGYGHGIGPIVLLGFYAFIAPETNFNDIIEAFRLIGSYEEVIPSVSLLLSIGFLLLLFAIFIKKGVVRQWIAIIGIFLMMMSYLFLVLPLNNGLRILSGVSGLPFALLSVKLIIEIFIEKKLNSLETKKRN